jgi:hypothetical protein
MLTSGTLPRGLKVLDLSRNINVTAMLPTLLLNMPTIEDLRLDNLHLETFDFKTLGPVLGTLSIQGCILPPIPTLVADLLRLRGLTTLYMGRGYSTEDKKSLQPLSDAQRTVTF